MAESNARVSASRVLALWCPDWSAVAAAAALDLPPTRPVAVTFANRVVACSAIARAEGVRLGARSREAQANCPELYTAGADPDRDARLFEPVVAAVDAVAPGVEVLRPGLLLLAARGVVRYFGSEFVAAERLVDGVGAVGVESQVGIADELSTAVIAARHAAIVPPGGGAAYLAPLRVAELAAEPGLAAPERVDLVDLLHRLGLRRIGDFAALSATAVASRFGADAIRAHRSARAEPERAPAIRAPVPDLVVEGEYDPPIDRVDAAAFAGRALAARLHTALASAALACTKLLIRASTGNGEHLARTWRCAEPLTPDGTAERVRWQLDGWLTGHGATRPSAPIIRIRLEPVELIAAAALQLGLWGGVGAEDEQARRALVRVQALLGPQAVRVGVPSGGRGPAERITLVPLGDEPVPRADPALPWPGRLPAPAPALVFEVSSGESESLELETVDGRRVRVTDRGMFDAVPDRLRRGARVWQLTAWAGPWPVDEYWWDHRAHPAARAQVRLDDPDGGIQVLLLICRGEFWSVEGIY